jgi:very-short-patch-repair endonuclease
MKATTGSECVNREQQQYDYSNFKLPSPSMGEGLGVRVSTDKQQQWVIPEPLRLKMVEVARALRRTPTPTEALLWQNLRSRQRGYKVRRQQPIGPFVVDFYIPKVRLIVEIDGLIHIEQQDKDREPQVLLEQLGLRFVRFSTAQVEQHLAKVLYSIDYIVQAPLSLNGTRAGGEGVKEDKF